MENNNTNNNVILHSIIVILLLVIAGLGFFIYGGGNNNVSNNNSENNKKTEANNSNKNTLENKNTSQIEEPKLGKADEKLKELNSQAKYNNIDKNNIIVKDGDNVKVQYTGTKTKNGEKFDSSYDRGQALSIQMGAGKMIPGFEKALLGMKIGEEKTITLEPSEAYGEIDPNNKQIVPRKELKSYEDAGVELKKGNNIDTPYGSFEILDANENEVTINTNHPLAGETLTFEIKVEDIIRRSEVKGKLDVFLMGYCPFGEIAAKAIPNLQKTFGDDLAIDLHYIANKTGTGYTAKDFQSLHGTPEAEEDIRQLCIKKYNGINSTIDYLQTRYKNADNHGKITDDVQIAYDAVGLNSETINNCIENGEGGKLLEADIKLAEELGIGASPTWLANNKSTFGGIAAPAIQTEFCKYNPELKGCENTIETSAPAGNGQPSCN